MPDLLPRVVVGALSCIYILAGVLKLYPFTNDIEQEMLKEFTTFAKVFPFGFQADPKFYQMSIGAVELLLGIGLMFGSRPVKKLCCGSLMLLMVGATQSLFRLQRYGNALVPVSFFALLGYSMYSINNKNSREKTM